MRYKLPLINPSNYELDSLTLNHIIKQYLMNFLHILNTAVPRQNSAFEGPLLHQHMKQ